MHSIRCTKCDEDKIRRVYEEGGCLKKWWASESCSIFFEENNFAEQIFKKLFQRTRKKMRLKGVHQILGTLGNFLILFNRVKRERVIEYDPQKSFLLNVFLIKFVRNGAINLHVVVTFSNKSKQTVRNCRTPFLNNHPLIRACHRQQYSKKSFALSF